MTTYGNPSRVSVDVSGGGITGISGGNADKLVIFARGSGGEAQPNVPETVGGPGSLEDTFGTGSEIVSYFRQAVSNGVPYSRITGVMPSNETTTDEDITNGGEAGDHTSGTEIANAPLIEDVSSITFEDSTSTELTVEFRYETNKDSTNADFTNLSPESGTVFINPLTGEWVAGSTGDYTVSYEYNDWQSAFDAATGIVEEQESGEWYVGVGSESVLNDAIDVAGPLREDEWKMIRVFGDARPNMTSEQDTAHFNVDDYSDSLDNEAAFVFAPTRLDDSTLTVGGAIAGIAASHDVDEPILGETLSEVGELDQTLTVPEQQLFEGNKVIPLSNRGSPMIEDNVSTSEETDWLRTFFSVKLADRIVLAARAIAKATRGELNSDTARSNVEQLLTDELRDLVDGNVLVGNTSDETNWFVNATQDETNQRKIGLSFGFTPTGVVDTVTVDTTINF